MIYSMTGYGAARRVEDGVVYALEIRSLNSRYLKFHIKLPEFSKFAESVIEKLLRSRLARGSVSFALRAKIEDDSGAAPINQAVLQRYVDALCQVRVSDGVEPTIDLASLASLPGVCEAAEPDERMRTRWLAIIERITNEALDALLLMRGEEGKALSADLTGACESIRSELKIVTDRAPTVIDEYHERLKTRVGRLMREGTLELEADSLAREVAIYAERCDISEEVIRLSSHLDQFVELCEKGRQVGRKLDFLTQELLREANTIASKSNDATIIRGVVQIKAYIDRLKEQVQNVE